MVREAVPSTGMSSGHWGRYPGPAGLRSAAHCQVGWRKERHTEGSSLWATCAQVRVTEGQGIVVEALRGSGEGEDPREKGGRREDGGNRLSSHSPGLS